MLQLCNRKLGDLLSEPHCRGCSLQTVGVMLVSRVLEAPMSTAAMAHVLCQKIILSYGLVVLLFFSCHLVTGVDSQLDSKVQLPPQDSKIHLWDAKCCSKNRSWLESSLAFCLVIGVLSSLAV